jgi:hypothetical protein
MKWIIIPIAFFATLIYCEYEDLSNFRNRRSIENFIKLCCQRTNPQSECYLEEWSGGDINFYVVIKTAEEVRRIPVEEFIDYCQCSDCCD